MHQQPIATPVSQQRQLSSRPRGKRGKKTKKKVDPNAPLINEHLVAELFNQKKRETVTAETYQVRLIIDQGFNTKPNGEADAEESDGEGSDNNSAPQLVSLSEAMATAHDLALDLMEVTLKAEVPVIKAVDFDSWLYKQRRKEKEVSSKRKKEGGGAISDRQLKEFKFRAGIADHDLQRKASNMVKYLEKGHACRITLTARYRNLQADALAIETTLERVKELVGDKAVEARGMKANDRKSFGSLLLHPNKKS